MAYLGLPKLSQSVIIPRWEKKKKVSCFTFIKLVFQNYPLIVHLLGNINVIIVLFILSMNLKEGQNRKFILFMYLIFEEELIF